MSTVEKNNELVLFCGIAFSHCGMRLDPLVEAFAKDLGLILFVYSIGLQVGPGFFSSFGKQSLKMNLMAACISSAPRL